jgi:hypothetical protein
MTIWTKSMHVGSFEGEKYKKGKIQFWRQCTRISKNKKNFSNCYVSLLALLPLVHHSNSKLKIK